jgi:hypothetical protein
MFKSAPSAAFIELAYLTGILPIKRYNSESALNNFREFTMTRPGRLAEYIGFTEAEVKVLCSEYDMNFDGLKDDILQMLAGERVPVDVSTFENDMTSFHNRDDVLTLLIHLGYLAYDRSRKAYIPNEEVKSSFYRAIRVTNWIPVLEVCKASDALLKATINGDCDAVAAGIDAVHMANTSILNYNDENALALPW